jgi:hypothetical protein
MPLRQLSLCVHALPSLHAVPFGLFVWKHNPVAGLHASVVHALESSQFTGVAVHVPL